MQNPQNGSHNPLLQWILFKVPKINSFATTEVQNTEKLRTHLIHSQ